MPELQDLFRLYGESYRQKRGLSYAQQKAMTAITDCRTAKLGAHLGACDSCGAAEISYNSCRNRHCPKCQTLSKERWIDAQKHNLLNLPYFHVVFTVPDVLRPVFYQNQRKLYTLLFRTVAETLQQLAADKKHLGATLGFSSILHTWGQTLCYHPHIHCIIPAGGLTALGAWKNSRRKFFLPVRVLSRKFRGKFLALLKLEKLEFHGNLRHLDEPRQFQNLLDICYQKEWVCYCKPPFQSAACVVEYLGRYTHRVAISNNRILSIQDGRVTFKWRDYKDRNRQKIMTVSAHEFIRRFLQHVLPHGFTKIRHYGFLANRNKTAKLLRIKRLTDTKITNNPKASTAELLSKMFDRDISICIHCGLPRCLSPPKAA
jgi:hypothetical protein